MGRDIFRNALFLFCLVLIVLNTACKPKPVISVDKDGGCAPLAVNFDAGKSSDMGKDIREYLWDLNGDGVFETHGVKAAYTYRKSGEYKVGLRVTDSKNNVAETSFMIHASGVPSADINADDGYITAGEKTRITWNASGADSVTISQGIGRVENTGSIEVSPLRNTTYTITATNPCGTNTDSVEIRVNSTACTAVITRTAPTGCNSVNEAFDASLSTDTDNDITSYEWDFDNDGTTDATGIRTNHTFSGEGNYTTKLTIRDAKGNSSEATVDTRIYGRTSLDFTVDSQDVVYPDSAVLRWHAENVTSVSLYDSALDVTLNYPVNNITFTDNVVYRPVYYPTTLTVTATGPCGSVSKSFSMTPHPTRCDARYTTGLRAGCTPFTLNFDASSSWDIDNDIISYEWDFDNDGITDATGINVSYTYTKRGAYNAFLTIKDAAGNSSSYSELVRVHSAPEVTFTSDTGGVIGPDGYVTLRWETVDATNVCLDINGSCGYNFNGAERVAQTGTRTYTITVSNDCSTTTKTLTIRPDSPISVNITSPASNESISSTDTIVRGTVSNPLGGETMVVVNGIPAFLYGNQFVASGVPLERDMPTTITVDAIGEFGNKGQASLDVTSRVSRKLVSISCDDMTGMSPMETKLKVSVPSSLSYQLVSLRPASGNIEFTESAEEYIHPARLTGEGVYIFTVKATDTDNREYSDSISIVVQDKAKIDTLLRSKWDDMKEAMRNNDVEGALKNFSGASTNEYREIFTILRDKLPELAQNMSNMEPVYINETVAKYRIKRNQVINGEQHTITYYVSFTIDPFGKWSIDGF